jgi:hypothetical protein
MAASGDATARTAATIGTPTNRWMQISHKATEDFGKYAAVVPQGLAECLADDTADRLLLRADAALRRAD